jgi:hypothetical protein
MSHPTGHFSFGWYATLICIVKFGLHQFTRMFLGWIQLHIPDTTCFILLIDGVSHHHFPGILDHTPQLTCRFRDAGNDTDDKSGHPDNDDRCRYDRQIYLYLLSRSIKRTGKAA